LIRLGTRASALALAQARWVAERLGEETEVVPIATRGESPPPAADKSRWVSGLERALLAGEIDVAVHSAKDVPAELSPGLCVLAIPPRADPRDAICGARGLDALAPGARVGTSSLRRAAQLRAVRDDLEVVEIRGNVDTRLRRLATEGLDALVLARAGLERLGRLGEAGGTLDELVPAAGQGALLVEARCGESLPVDGLADPVATGCVLAERALTRRLGASCNTPVGALATPVGDGGLELRAWVGVPDGSRWIADRMRGASEDLGCAVAERMLTVGAGELLRRTEQELGP
jgi:hydroxymethylbilane synthase